MAINIMDKDLELFECEVCFEVGKDPYILPCGHSGCFDCLNSIKDTTRQCHMCRSELNSKSIISKNIDLCHILENIKLKRKSENQDTTNFWSNLILNADIQKNIEKLNWHFPTLVQIKSIPEIISGKHLLIESPNGTGKTGSFVIGSISSINSFPQALQIICISHTKEIKDMHFQIFSRLCDKTGLVAYKTERSSKPSSSFQPHILCGTLDSCINYFNRNCKKPGHIKLIVDECDEILNQQSGQLRLKSLIDKIPDKQVILYSATLSEASKSFCDNLSLNYEMISIEQPTHLNPKVKVFNFSVKDFNEKNNFVLNVLRTLGFKMCIIFINTKKCAAVLGQLMEKGYKAVIFSGDLDHDQREEALRLVESGNVNILISTDLLGRGFDCRKNDLVINYDCPRDCNDQTKPNFSSFFHRCGRTGRNGRHGTVINLVSNKDSNFFAQVFSRLSIPINLLQPNALSSAVSSVAQNLSDYITDYNI